jgi:hypothetical protein
MRVEHDKGGGMKKRLWLVVVIAAWAATGEGVEGSNLNRTATEGWATARIRDLRLRMEAEFGRRPTYEEAESIAASAATAINPGQATRLVHVDGAATNTVETGSAAAPYRTIQAALDHIGQPTDAAEYRAEAGRAYVVRVAPGVYAEDLEVPYRPALLLDLDGATVRGTVRRRVPEWPYSASNLISRLTIRGDSLRAAYPDGQHAVTGIEGDIVFDGGGAYPRIAPSYFYALHLIHAGVSGAVRFENGSPHTWGHLFLERADVHGVHCTNGWGGVTVFSYGWGGGHAGVRLDAASYNSWLAATTNVARRGAWRLGEGGRMALTDAPEPQVTGTNAPTLTLPRWTGDELVVTGAVKQVYKAFGGGTNDWVLLGP